MHNVEKTAELSAKASETDQRLEHNLPEQQYRMVMQSKRTVREQNQTFQWFKFF